MFDRHARSDQRAGFRRGLDHGDTGGKSGYQAIAAREMPRLRCFPKSPLRDDRTGFGDHFHEVGIVGGISDVDTGCDDRDRAAAAFDGSLMRGRVDAARKAGNDGKAAGSQILGHRLREQTAAGAGIARADKGDGRPKENVRITSDRQERRRIMDLTKQTGIARFAMGDEMGAKGGNAVKLGFRLVTRAAPAFAPVTFSRNTRQFVESATRAAEAM